MCVSVLICLILVYVTGGLCSKKTCYTFEFMYFIIILYFKYVYYFNKLRNAVNEKTREDF